MPQLLNPSFHIARTGIPRGGNRRDKTGDATYLTSPGPSQSKEGEGQGEERPHSCILDAWSRAVSSSQRSQSGPSLIHLPFVSHPWRTGLLGEGSWTLSESSQPFERSGSSFPYSVILEAGNVHWRGIGDSRGHSC